MIRAIRPNAMAQDDASMISGWNIAPNVEYFLRLLPSSVSCGVFLYAADGATLIASGAALAGTGQPCILIPQTGQTVEMVDADLGWHLLLTTTGTESQRTIRLGPAVDLPDEIHPVYGEDGLAMVRATAAIDTAAHYIDDITVTCPLGLGAGLGNVVSVQVDGATVVGQVESITWAATPDGTTEQAVIRRHVAIAPDAFVEVTPPTVADDSGTATHLAGASGNVLTNDATGLTVVAVAGLSSNVGATVDGDNGGTFTINANGSWTFDPDGDFALLEDSETADTSITYHASDGTAEAMATLTVTVSHANTAPVAVDDAATTDAATTTSGNVLTNDTDADADSLTVSKVSGSTSNVGVAVAGSSGGLFTIASNGAWTFDPDGDFAALTGTQTATTSVTYHVSDGMLEDEGTLTVTVTATMAAVIELVGSVTGEAGRYGVSVNLPAGVEPGDLVLVFCAVADGSSALTISGYTQQTFVSYTGSARTSKFAILYKFMGSTPDTSVTIPGSGSSVYGAAGVIFVLRGVNSLAPFDVDPVYNTFTANQAVSAPSITPVTDGAFVITTIGLGIGTAPSMPGPLGFDGPISVANDPSTACYVAASYKQGDTAPTGVLSWRYTFANIGCACIASTFAIKPA